MADAARTARLLRFLVLERRGRIAARLLAAACSGAAVEAFRLAQASALHVDVSALSSCDLFALLFVGCRPFEPRPGVPFVPPLEWLLIMMAVLLASSVASDAPRGAGTEHQVVFCGSRRTWWEAHVLLALILAAAALASLYGVACLFALAIGGDLSGCLHADVLGFELLSASVPDAFPAEAAPVLLAQGVAIFALAAAQLALSLPFGPIVGYGAGAAVLVASSYAQSPWLLGNHAMLARSAEFFSDGIALSTSVCASALALAVAATAGAFAVSRADLMGKGVAR